MLGEFQDVDLIFLQKLLQMNNSGPMKVSTSTKLQLWRWTTDCCCWRLPKPPPSHITYQCVIYLLQGKKKLQRMGDYQEYQWLQKYQVKSLLTTQSWQANFSQLYENETWVFISNLNKEILLHIWSEQSNLLHIWSVQGKCMVVVKVKSSTIVNLHIITITNSLSFLHTMPTHTQTQHPLFLSKPAKQFPSVNPSTSVCYWLHDCLLLASDVILLSSRASILASGRELSTSSHN